MHLFGPRYICVGFNKTGTTSIARAFHLLGLGPVAQPGIRDPGIRDFDYIELSRAIFDRGDFEPALRIADGYRAFKDRPWNIWDMHRLLDRRFPGSCFILTVRDNASWWDSVERWLAVPRPEDPDRLRRYLAHLRAERFDRAAFIEGYERHNDAVRSYFEGRGNLLVMNLEEGHGWEKLCGFLGRPVPDRPFPRANRNDAATR